MAEVVNVNGRISDAQQATISVFDHGFLYGEGVYETIRTYNRRPFLFDRHMRRLRQSAGMIDLPVPLSDAACLDRVIETMTAAAEIDEVYIRILLTRGVGELTYDPVACPEPSLVIIVKPHQPTEPALLARGVTVALASIVRNHPDTVNPRIKSNNLLNNALAMQEAIKQNAYEALMRNYRGELAECSLSNFFLVRGGAALTPPVDAGLLEGITRNFVFEVGAHLGVSVQEAVLRDADLGLADEAFLTSTTREIVPIVKVGDTMIADGTPGPVTRRLLEGLRQKARELSTA